MKRIVTIIAVLSAGLFAAASLNAKDNQYEYDLAEFTTIKVGGNFEVFVQSGNTYHATVTVDEACHKLVTCSVKGSTLTIYANDKDLTKDIKNLLNGKQPVYKAVVTMPKGVEEIILEDKAVLDCAVLSEGESVKVTMSDFSRLKNLTVNSKYFYVNTDKKADAVMNVTAEDVEVNMNGSSSISLTQKGKTVSANIASFASYTLYCETESLSLTAKGSSKALLKGKAPSASYNLNGATNVNAVEVETEEADIKMVSVCTLTESATKRLNVDLQSGCNLIFDNDPDVTVSQIKAANMKKYKKE